MLWLNYDLSTCLICCSLILRLECFHVFQRQWSIDPFPNHNKIQQNADCTHISLTMLFFLSILMSSQYTPSVQGSAVCLHNWIFVSINEFSSMVPYEEFNTVLRTCHFTVWILAATVVYLVNVKCINITHNLTFSLKLKRGANKLYLHN